MAILPKKLSYLLLLLVLGAGTAGTTRAQSVFFSSSFDSGIWPSEFDLGPDVERLSPEGAGTGEFVPAWRLGNATEANNGGFFPVPDLPTGNVFAMANDDASPCNCAMDNVSLTLNAPSFVGRSSVALECRVFHERTLGGGEAFVEVSANGGPWIMLATIPVLADEWQTLMVNLSAFDGSSGVRVRFRWSDGNTWASGFAVDDIVLRERVAVDLSVEHVYAHDPTASAFLSGDQSLQYSMLPVEQASPLTVTVELMNRGTSVLDGVSITANVALDGVVQTTLDTLLQNSLLPGERQLVVISSDWVPAVAGQLTVTANASSLATDGDLGNNTGNAQRRYTSAGWDEGYGAMARDLGQLEGSEGSDEAFIIANRMELVQPGSVARGISTFITSSSAIGADVRAILMDDVLAFVDTSTRHTITQEDIDRAWIGEPLYLPLTGSDPLASGDYFVGLQLLDGGQGVYVATSGNSPIGAALLMQGVNFDVEYIRSTPMVRLHLNDYGVGLDEVAGDGPGGLLIFPSPLSGTGTVVFESNTPSRARLRLLDSAGRAVFVQDLGTRPAGTHRIALDVLGLANGAYVAELTLGDQRSSTRFVIAQ